ncbi:MAG: hypothetical protein AAB874_04110 [Patescibacteria group bacterium]
MPNYFETGKNIAGFGFVSRPCFRIVLQAEVGTMPELGWGVADRDWRDSTIEIPSNRSACLVFAIQPEAGSDIYALVIADKGRKGAIITPYSWKGGELPPIKVPKGKKSLPIPGTKYSVNHFVE